MRCLACDQVLWNLPAPPEGAPRACPECGEAFRVGDYRFRTGKVDFCCPHCAHAHAGGPPRGLPPADPFDCAGCGRSISVESCTLRPVGVEDERDALLSKELPWLGKGTLPARWWRTMALGFSRGSEIPEMLGRRAPAMSAALFLCTTVWATASLGFLVSVASLAGVFMRLGIAAKSPTAATTLAAFIGAPAAALACTAVAAGLAQAAGRSQGLGFARAFSLIAFSSGGLVLGLVIPCAGMVIAPVVWAIQASYAVAGALPRGRATAPVLAVVAGIIGTTLAVAGARILLAILAET